MGLDHDLSVMLYNGDTRTKTIAPICTWRKCHRVHNFFGNVFRTSAEALNSIKPASLESALDLAPYIYVNPDDVKLLLKAMVRSGIVQKSRRKVRVRMLQRSIFLKSYQKVAKGIPPLVAPAIEQRLSKENIDMIGALVGGECKYERMFDGPFYPKDEHRCDAMPTKKDREAMQELVDDGDETILYSASW